jgi:Bacterial regulatory helix-turn-helix protein, lysR family
MLNRYYQAINAPKGSFLKHHWFTIMDRLTSMSVFVKVADLGSFAAAAKELRLSPTMIGISRSDWDHC